MCRTGVGQLGLLALALLLVFDLWLASELRSLVYEGVKTQPLLPGGWKETRGESVFPADSHPGEPVIKKFTLSSAPPWLFSAP